MANNNSFAQQAMTFGIELEFIGLYPRTLFNTERTPDLASALSRGFVAAGIASTGHETLDDDININADDKQYSKWIVQEEGGLTLSDKAYAILEARGLQYDTCVAQLEISSRKFAFGEDWQNEIRTVLNVFEQMRAMGVYFITNGTTGFHMHVGFGDTLMPLRTAKNVFQLVTGFEDRLDGLYSTTRMNEKAAISDTHFNAGLAWHFQNNEATDFGLNIFHWLVSIEEAKTHEALGKFFANYVDPTDEDPVNSHYSTLNMDNLYPGEMPGEPKQTIEFRQHEGTLDFKEICAFIEFKKTLVSYCHNVSDISFLQLCQQVSNPMFELMDLITAIGGSSELVAYHRHRNSHAAFESGRAQSAQAVAAVNDPSTSCLRAVASQTVAENWQTINIFAREGKIHHKRIVGAYADLAGAHIDVPVEYSKFIACNRPFVQSEELLTMARIMIFQQMNGSDSS